MNPVSGEVLLEVPALAAGHPLFAGHFPGQPIIPGAWLLDQVDATVLAARWESRKVGRWLKSNWKPVGCIRSACNLPVAASW